MRHKLMLLSSVLLLAGCAARQAVTAPAPEPFDSDSPARISGRVAPTVARTAKQAEYAERLKQIEEATRLRMDLLAKFPPPTLVCPRVRDGSVTIDGDLSDAAWSDAPVAVIERDTRTGNATKSKATVRVVWDSRNLYFAFDLEDKEVAAAIAKHDGELWREDVAEVFLDANGDESSYLEIEVNPLRTIYDASVADYRPEVTWVLKNVMELDLDATINTFRAKGMRVGIKVNGKLNDATGDDRGWTCEIALPWEDIARGTNVNHVPPRDGDVWRAGLYRNDVNPMHKTEEYAAWNPTGTWFHRPAAYGRLLFVER